LPRVRDARRTSAAGSRKSDEGPADVSVPDGFVKATKGISRRSLAGLCDPYGSPCGTAWCGAAQDLKNVAYRWQSVAAADVRCEMGEMGYRRTRVYKTRSTGYPRCAITLFSRLPGEPL
jgi:hypothetical protein